MTRRLTALFALMITGLFVLSACADPAQPTSTATSFNPTPAGGSPQPTPTAGATVQPTSGVQPTEPPSGGGDPQAGQAAFGANGCSACHSTGSNPIVGPGLAGVGARAGDRVPELSAEEYIVESIKDPRAFTVEGFTEGVMPAFPQLSDTDINNLVAYLMTLE